MKNEPYMKNFCYPNEPNKKAYMFEIRLEKAVIEVQILFNGKSFHTSSFKASYGARFGIDVEDFDVISNIIDLQVYRHSRRNK